MRPVNKIQILIGALALLVGSSVYLIDRPPEQTYFVVWSKIDMRLLDTIPNIFGILGNSLPDFVHVFSFILITAGLLSCHKRGYLVVCFSWFLVDGTFELGQKYHGLYSRLIPDWFAGIPFLENTKNYFQKGTFDTADLLAIAVGTAIAYLVLLNTGKREERT